MARAVATCCLVFAILAFLTGLILPVALLTVATATADRYGLLGIIPAALIGLAAFGWAGCLFALGALFDSLDRIEHNTRSLRRDDPDDRRPLDWTD